MSQQKRNDDDGDASVGEAQNATLTSKNSIKKIESDPVVEESDVEESSFLEQWQNSRFWLVKGSYYLLRSVWLIVMAIGTIIVWLISMIFI